MKSINGKEIFILYDPAQEKFAWEIVTQNIVAPPLMTIVWKEYQRGSFYSVTDEGMQEMSERLINGRVCTNVYDFDTEQKRRWEWVRQYDGEIDWLTVVRVGEYG